MNYRVHDWLCHLKNVNRLSEATLLAYRQDVDAWIAFLAEKSLGPDEAVKTDARSFLTRMSKARMAASSVNRRLAALNSYYNWCRRHGCGGENPFQDIRSIKQGRRLPDYLSYEEIDSLICITGDDFGGKRDRVLMEMLYSTGCRIGELCSLNIDDVQKRQVRIRGKGNRERFVFIGSKAAKVLEDYFPIRLEKVSDNPDSRQALLLSARGNRLTPRGARHLLQKYVGQAGTNKSIHPHAFRHSFATHIYDEGANIRTVQELLGHASLATTQIYTHTGIERIKRVYRDSHPHGRRND